MIPLLFRKFADSSATADIAYVTSAATPASAAGFLTTLATPESPISAQLIQSTVAPFISMDRFGLLLMIDLLIYSVNVSVPLDTTK